MIPKIQLSQPTMTSRRIAKITQAIREQVSSSILFDLKDPRVNNVTVTRVEVSPDGQQANIYVSIMGDEKQQELCMHGLRSARGFLQAKVAARIQTRYTPILTFKLDPGVKRSIEISQLLREASPKPESVDFTDGNPSTADDQIDEGESSSTS
ncbi:MAG: 30S ribosome-binding factor RbfA [Planctomycetaceae bacterium]